MVSVLVWFVEVPVMGEVDTELDTCGVDDFVDFVDDSVAVVDKLGEDVSGEVVSVVLSVEVVVEVSTSELVVLIEVAVME